MKIITVSREFGSGGRELGKRLADALNIAYYDREIIDKIAENLKLDAQYIDKVLERGYTQQYPYTFRRSFYFPVNKKDQYSDMMAEQTKLIRDLAEKESCVIVGRGADVLLKEHCPFKIFVYADMKSKKERCSQRASKDEHLSEREIEQKIRNIDKRRASDYSLLSSKKWGDKSSYHLCVNTSGIEIPSIVPIIAEYAEYWFSTNVTFNHMN